MALFTNSACKLFAQTFFSGSARTQWIASRGIKRFVAPTMREIVKRQMKAKPLPVEKTKRSNYIEWNYNAEIFAFGKRLGEDFKIELLLQAFIHRSYVVQEELRQKEVGIENPSLTMNDNNELSKRGEKIISETVKQFISSRLPRLPLEGVFTLHNYLLSDEVVANISKNLGTTEIILSAEYPVEVSTLAKTFKAIVGALAESQSVERANQFVKDFVLTCLAELEINDVFYIEDPLKVLSDILLRDNRGTPEPRIIGQSAMNEILATFIIGIYSDRQLLGQGPGETLEIATEMAARDALNRLFRTDDASAPIDFRKQFVASSVENLPLSAWKESAFQ